MTVHHARAIALAAVLAGISALVPITRLHAQQPLDELALDELRALAEQGEATAQNNLGIKYAYGQVVQRDDAEAVRWWRLAADQGYARAQFNLGVAYTWHPRNGIPPDDAEAVRWYRLAADQGFVHAQDHLGFIYLVPHTNVCTIQPQQVGRAVGRGCGCARAS